MIASQYRTVALRRIASSAAAVALLFTSAQTWAIGNGTLDSSDQYPYVVDIPHGSGTLISPVLILTANHVITGSVSNCLNEGGDAGNGAELTALTSLIAHGGGAGLLQPLYHTPGPPQNSGPVYVRTSLAIDMCNGGPQFDMAVILLDYITPPGSAGWADPYHLPFRPGDPGYPGCGTDQFEDAVAIGFGCNGSLLTDKGCVLGAPKPRRTYNFPKTWFFDSNESWASKWSVLELADYDGNLVGDSGGPLIQLGSNAICGVGSRYGFPATSGFPLYLPELMSNYSSVTEAANYDFLRNTVHVIDDKGRYLGECLVAEKAKFTDPRVSYNDADGDRIPDGCDPAPNKADDQYVKTGHFADEFMAADADGDGVLDKFDNCPSTPNPIQVDQTKCAAPVPGAPQKCAAFQQDTDGDGVGDVCDNCPRVKNPNQADTDSDGLGDACDTCPAVENVIHCTGSGLAATCGGPPDFDYCVHPYGSAVCAYQPDDVDNDGIGDACDDCSAVPNSIPCGLAGDGDSFCALGGTEDGGILSLDDNKKLPTVCVRSERARNLNVGGGGVCSNQPDADNDGRGDACDNCPSGPVPNWVFHNNSPGLGSGNYDNDGDGLGNECDRCAVAHDAVPCGAGLPSCESASLGSCLPLGTLPDGTPVGNDPSGTILDNGVAYHRVCSKVPNDDGDKYGNACDNCKSVANDDQLNCNLAEEMMNPDKYSYPWVGDACDNIPCTKLKHTSSQLTDEQGTTISTFDYSPYVLPANASKGKVGLSQLANGHPSDVLAQVKYCVGDFSQCPKGTQAVSNPLVWTTIHQSVDNQAPAPAPFSVSASYDIHFTRAVDPSPSGNPDSGYLNKADTYSTVWSMTDQLGVPFAGLNANLFSHTAQVKYVKANTIGTGTVPSGEFTTYSNFYPQKQSYGVFPPAAPAPGDDCPKGGNYPSLACDKLNQTGGFDGATGTCAPLEFPCGFSTGSSAPWSDGKGLLMFHPAGDASAQPGYFVRTTEAGDQQYPNGLDETAAAALLAPGVIWLTPSETDEERAATRIGFASLTADGSALVSVLARSPSGSYGNIATRRGSADGGDLAPNGVVQSAALPSGGKRLAFGSALSAKHEAAFVVGGHDSLTGAALNDVVALQLNGAATTLPLHAGPRPADVLAVLYRYSDETLFVVDTNAPEAKKRVRLLKIDLATGNVTLIGMWAAPKQVDGYYLSNGLDGQVVLLGTSSTQHWYVGGEIAAHDNKMFLKHLFLGKGTAVLPAAVMTMGTKVAYFDAKAKRLDTKLFRHPQHDLDDEQGCEGLFP